MEESSKGRGVLPQLLDLIPDEKEWKLEDTLLVLGRSRNTGFGGDEDRKLELKLGLPGLAEEKRIIHQETTALSLGYHLPKHANTTTTTTGAKRGFLDTVQDKTEGYNNEQKQQAGAAACGKELTVEENTAAARERKKGCCPPLPRNAPAATTPARNRPQAQGRAAAVPVVGWPPIRSFRRNLATCSSSKQQSPKPQNGEVDAKVKINCKKIPLVKINMDGIPIGRKIDLAAYDNYKRLSLAVKELFKGFLEAQREPSIAESAQQGADEKIFSELLDGSGEYTLVYEDNEGDKMLVGDIPWNVFVSTAKRLRVLRSSELCHALIGAAPGRVGNC